MKQLYGIDMEATQHSKLLSDILLVEIPVGDVLLSTGVVFYSLGVEHNIIMTHNVFTFFIDNNL